MLFDLPLDQLKTYLPERSEPADFDAFWSNSQAETRRFPLEPHFNMVETNLRLVDVFDVTFNGFGGQPIKAWLLLPHNTQSPLACIVEYIGYGGGRGLPHEWLQWVSAGYAHFVMDTRGQGSEWRQGETPDIEPGGSNPQAPGFMTRGVLKPETYYYRRLFMDAVRAVEAARSHPLVDPARVGVCGASQGGGVTLAVAGLIPDLGLAMPDVPFLCHYRRAVELVDTDPYYEIVRFCKIHRQDIEKVFSTLSYFDGLNFAARARMPALFSVGLMDMTCPPSTVFAAYNHYAGAKDIRIWEFNKHEGGEAFQQMEKYKFAAARFA